MERHAGARLLSAVLVLFLTALPGSARAAGASMRASVPWTGAWPMVGHDPQRTARSASAGPLHPRLLWTYQGANGPPLIGPDGGVDAWSRSGFMALTPTGRARWTAPIQYIEGGPAALGLDGMLRVNAQPSAAHPATATAGDPHMAIVALSPAGRTAWTIRSLPWATVPRSVPFSKGEAPLVTAANVLYVPLVGPVYSPGQNNGVEVVSPTGTPLRRVLAGWSGTIALGRDGSVYEVGSDLQGGLEVLASRPDGTLRWSHPVAYDQWGAALVGRDGTVYASDGSGGGSGEVGEVVAYTPAGRLRWRWRGHGGAPALAERGDGVILAADASGLTAIGPRGARLWRRALGSDTAAVTGASSPSLAVDAVGRAYVGSSDGFVRAVSPGGALLWTLRAGGPSRLGNVPALALGPNGILAVTGTDGVLGVYR